MSGFKVGQGKSESARKENKACLFEGTFVDRLNDRRLSARLGERSRGSLFIHQTKIPAREPAFLKQRFQLRPQQRRRTRNHDSVGIPFE
jgi:hypothetical protein